MRILIVEDDLEAAAVRVRGLTESGQACASAPDGVAGLDQARAGEFDVRAATTTPRTSAGRLKVRRAASSMGARLMPSTSG